MTEIKISVLLTLPKLLLALGLLTIVYLGFTLHLTQQQYSQRQFPINIGPTLYPIINDQIKLKRELAAYRFVHQFSYNGNVWPVPHNRKIGEHFVPIKRIILIISGDSAKCNIFKNALDRYDRVLQPMISNSDGLDVNAIEYTVTLW